MRAGRRRRWDPGTLAVAALVGALAFAVRLLPALGNALWQDEVASARILIRPAMPAIRQVVATESTPPAWYGLAWLVHKLGVPVAEVRLLSVVCGALLAGLVVVYAARLLPLSAAALAGTLVALGWQPVLHGWELRAYALLAVASLLFVLLLESCAAAPTLSRLALLGGSVALGSMTHYFFLLTLLSGLAWLLLSPELEEHRVRIAAACAAGMIPLLVWTPAAFAQYRHGAFTWIGPFDASDVAEVYVRLFARSVPAGATSVVLGLLAVTVIVFGAVQLWRHPSSGRLCALAAVMPVSLAALAWLAGAHVFTVRNLLGAAPFAAVAAGAAITSLPRRVVPAAAVAAIALIVFTYAGSRRAPPRFDQVADALVQEGWRPRDPVLILGPPHAYLHPLSWYLSGDDDLVLAEPRRGRACPRVYVVSVRGLSLTPVARRRVGSVLVARVRGSEAAWAEMRRKHGVAAGSSRQLPACLRKLD